MTAIWHVIPLAGQFIQIFAPECSWKRLLIESINLKLHDQRFFFQENMRESFT